MIYKTNSLKDFLEESSNAAPIDQIKANKIF